ncbi:MAG: flagellar biosynthesis protein FlhB [Treponemataceae bacterium]|nr:flagellar biosynthesis protein FlhB [Treponemataceae bacterium]
MIDLQWFASAEEEDRTEQPSEHKLRKAREEGRIPKSQEVTGALVMLLVVLSLVALGSWIFSGCIEVIVFYLSNCTKIDLLDPAVGKVFLQFFLKSIVPLAATALVAALAGNIIQNKGFIFTTKTITPKFNKLIPKFGEYFKKTLFSMEGIFNVVKSLLKVAAVFISAWIIIKNDLPTLLSMMNVNLWNGMVYLAGMVIKLLLVAAIIFLVVAVPDYFVQRHQFMESMKMTKQEVKEEYKELEGDPFVKGRLKQYIREMMSRNMRENVAKADVVITNPTHYAVALLYERETMQAPMVTAKGVDSVAQRIKQIARENDVEIVENKPLARALYAEVEIGDIIPEQYYKALSIILMRVYKIKGKK